LKRVKSFFDGNGAGRLEPDSVTRNSSGRRVRACKYPNLAASRGICPLEAPPVGTVGGRFRAIIVDARKGGWSSCRVTRDGDVLVFTNKGDGDWETDAGVPACPFKEGFHAAVID